MCKECGKKIEVVGKAYNMVDYAQNRNNFSQK